MRTACKYGVIECAFDKRFANQMAQNLQGRGITMVDTPQGFQLNEALRKVSDLNASGNLCHGNNPILSVMASNAVVRHGRNKEIRLDKEKAADKIDGISALTMAEACVIARRRKAVQVRDRGHGRRMSPAEIRQVRAQAIEARRDELLSVKEFAELIRVHPLTVYGWIRDDKLPGVYRFGNEIRIDLVLAERPARTHLKDIGRAAASQPHKGA